MWTMELLVMLGMIAMNGLFAGYEIALATVTLARLHVLDHEGKAGARAAIYMKEKMARSLTVIQIGITLFGAVAAAVGGAGAEKNLTPLLQQNWGVSAGLAKVFSILLVVVPLTVFSILFGELIPKVFALRNREWLCLLLSPPLRQFSALIRPVVAVFERIVNLFVNRIQRRTGRFAKTTIPDELAELREMAQLARTSRLISGREESIIRGATGLSNRSVRDIMLTADNIKMIHADDSLADYLVAAHLYLHTRFPVSEKEDDPQSIIGYVNFKDIISLMRLSPAKPSVRAILRPIPAVAESTSIGDALETMMKEHTHISLIRDPAGRITGMITLEDILEEIIGDIRDEYDRLPSHIVRSGDGWVIGGGAALEKIRETTGIGLPLEPGSPPSNLLTEWVVKRLGRDVEGGDYLEENSLRVVVRKIRRGQVLEAQLNPLKTD
ncbi:HlyC/CorC family transporter [bacterium]|nr:HlyC/CorC family transporter [bacterium]